MTNPLPITRLELATKESNVKAPCCRSAKKGGWCCDESCTCPKHGVQCRSTHDW